jgi:hypothetical protein
MGKMPTTAIPVGPTTRSDGCVAEKVRFRHADDAVCWMQDLSTEDKTRQDGAGSLFLSFTD